MIRRISERRAIERLSRHGRRARTDTLWCRYIDDPLVVPPQVAFAVGRPVGSATARNRVRRRLRELLRAATISEPPLLVCGQLLVGAGAGSNERSFDELGCEVSGLLRSVAGSRT